MGTPELQNNVCEHLPAWCKFRKWQRTFSPEEHGWSMQTFFRSQMGGGASLLVVRDANDCVFGCFVSEEWRISAEGYYGSPDCFLFTTHGCSRASPESPTCRVYHIAENSGKVLLKADSESLSLSSALFLQDNLWRGSTMACEAFNSPVLTDGGQGVAITPGGSNCDVAEFIVAQFEAWQLEPE